MKMLALALVVAVVVEALVSYGETIYDYFQEGDVKKAIKQVIAIIIAIVFAFQAKVTLISFFADASLAPTFDMIISGIFMSRGANFLFDLAKMIRRVAKDDFEFDELDEDEVDEDFDEEQSELILDDIKDEVK